MELLKKAILIWVVIFVVTAAFDLTFLNLTNGNFNFNYTIFFGSGVAMFTFAQVLGKPSNKRKNFVTTLEKAVRVKRNKRGKK